MKSGLDKFIILIVAISTVSCGSNRQINKTIEVVDDHSERIDSLIETTKPHFFNGVILITKGDDIIFKREHGYADFEKKTLVSLDDKFRIWSNSKQITAVLILKEVEKGTIDLHTPIRNYLPNFKQS